MQASLEAESRGKAEAMRMKKKLEQDINELEVALDAANRGRAEAEKNIKRYQVHMLALVCTLLCLLLSSSYLACSAIWGRRYSRWSYSSVLPCLAMSVVLSSLSPACVLFHPNIFNVLL